MDKPDEIEVLVVDDHKLMRDGLCYAINKNNNFCVTAEASNGEEAIIYVQDNFPDIIVMDVDMPVMDGIEATEIIKSIAPEASVIGVSLHKSPTVKEDMQQAGASAYITKDEASETLCTTIRKEVLSDK